MNAPMYPHRTPGKTDDHPQSLFPHRDHYVRPDRADDLYPKPVTVPTRAFKGTVFEQAHAAIAHANNEFQRHIETVNRDRHRYSDRNYERQIQLFADTDAAHAIDSAVANVRSRRDQAQAQVDRIRGSLTQPGDAAQESRNTRYWNRTKPKLDVAGAGAAQVAIDLVEKATAEELSVLIEELPSYFEVHMPEQSSGQRRRYLDNITAAIDAKVQQVIPTYAQAARELKKADQAVIMTEHNAKRVAAAITRGDQVPVQLTESRRVGDYDPDKP